MPICIGCGASFDNSFQFCPHCGRSTPKPQVEMNIKESVPVNACPICQLNDKIEKVSIIYMHGSHNTTMSVPVTEISSNSEGRTFSTTRQQQVMGLDETKLAQALQPPQKPEEPQPPSGNSYTLGGFFFVIFFCGAPVGGLVGLVISEFQSAGISESTEGVLMLSGLCIMALAVIFGAAFVAQKYNKAKKKYEADLTQYNSVVLLPWKRSLEKWNSLYFCHRDGYVFIPNEKAGVPLENIRNFISTNIDSPTQPRQK